MATAGGNPSVTDMMQNLQLTAEEEVVADFSDDEDVAAEAAPVWAIVGKVLSPVHLHVSTIQSAMRPAWGNPRGLKLRTIGVKEENMFMADFDCKADRDRVLAGSPWVVGKYSVLLQEYDERLSAAEIKFDRMHIWARLLGLPLG